MPTNDAAAGSVLRQPRTVIKLNGTEATPISWEIDTNSFYQADTFRSMLPLSKLPAGIDLQWFSSQGRIEVEIFAGFPANASVFTAADLETQFFGRVDDVSVDLSGRAITLNGRDLTADLIDTKSSEKFTNQTSSQIAARLAAKHGLTPVVTETKTKAGRFYATNHVRLQNEDTEWDLLTWLAKEEQFALYVQGKELHFEPLPAETADPYALVWRDATETAPFSFNGTRISTSRSLTLAKDIRVTVKSWNHKQKKGLERVATRGRKGAVGVQEYSYTVPGLTADQAQQRAEKILAELTKHEMKIAVSGPADNKLKKGGVLKLSGTGSAWDQVYYPASVHRSFSAQEGYVWQIDAKNHATESEPTL